MGAEKNRSQCVSGKEVLKMSEMIIEIEEDGTISVKTSDIADQHHLSAE